MFFTGLPFTFLQLLVSIVHFFFQKYYQTAFSTFSKSCLKIIQNIVTLNKSGNLAGAVIQLN